MLSVYKNLVRNQAPNLFFNSNKQTKYLLGKAHRL